MAHNWTNTNNRRHRLPGNWKTLRLRILRRDRWLCQIRYEGYCTVTATDVDHYGTDIDDHRPQSLRAACSACNQRRNILTRPAPKRVSTKRAPEPHPGLRQ